MTTLARVLSFSLSLTVAAIPSPGVAAEPSEEKAPTVSEAAQRYDRGLKLYAEGEYRLAVIEFERAYELVPDHRVLYNIAQVRIQLSDYARARVALTRYLSEGAGKLTPEREASVRTDLDMLDTRTATLEVRCNVNGAEVLIDGAAVGVTPFSEPLLINAGEHNIEVRKPGYRARVLRQTLAGKDTGRIDIELDELPKAVPATTDLRIAPTPASPVSRGPIWIGWTVTGALATSAAITGLVGMQRADDLDALRDKPDVPKADLEDKQAQARRLLVASDILTAGAVLVGGVSLYFTLKTPSRQEPSVALALSPGYVGVRSRY